MTPGPTAPDVGILAIQIIDSTLLQNAFKERQPLSILSWNCVNCVIDKVTWLCDVLDRSGLWSTADVMLLLQY